MTSTRPVQASERPTAHHRTTGRLRGDAGQAGGFEVIAFGLLVFVCGSLLIATAWAAVDIKLATDAATRDASQAYVEAPDETSATLAADLAARQAIESHGRDPNRLVDLQITPVDGYGRCARIEVSAAYPVPAVTLPWIGGIGEAILIRSRHSEVVDPYRSGLPGAAAC